MATYADLQDIVDWLGLTNENERVSLEDCLETASRAIDSHCGWSFDADTSASARLFIPFSPNTCFIDPFTETDTDNITVETDPGLGGSFSSTMVAGTHYQAEPLNQRRNGQYCPWHKLRAIRSHQWPTCRDQATVRVTATWGWSSVPEPVKIACLIEASRLHSRRRGTEGIVGFEGGGVARVAMELDKDAAAKLGPFVSPQKGVGLRG